MSENVSEVPPHLWDEYQTLQRKVSRSKIDSYTWALEDELNHFLDSVQGRLPTEKEERSKSLKTLVVNRTKKHSRRRRLLEVYKPLEGEESPEKIALHRLQLLEVLAKVRSATSESEWRILCSLANEHDYVTIAKSERMTIYALKSRISRCRQRLAGIAA
jgi:hypothetical protein